MRGLLVVHIAWLACSASSSAPESLSEARSRIDAEFRPQFETLANKCEQLGLAESAAATRLWLHDRDPGRQYLAIPGSAEGTPGDGNAENLKPTSAKHAGKSNVDESSAELVRKWFARLMQLRRERAARLFETARQQSDGGSATDAYQLLHEVLAEDPNHAESRRILGIAADSETRARRSRLPHAQYGWPRGKWWHVESPHFQIVTDHSAEAGLELVQRLEEFHCAWRQLFFTYWNTPSWLQEQFHGTAVRTPPQRRHLAVLFRDRAEYLERLAQVEPKIAVTLGYYHKSNRTSYFYVGEQSLLPVWYHEATHQLFQESGDAIPDVGEKWNFWVVEGIAVYMESLRRQGTGFTVGGFDADRLQFTRSRILGGEPPLALAPLVRLGRADLQQHPEIRRLYTLSAGLAHFFMDYDRGRYREPFRHYLSQVYVGQDKPESLSQIIPISAAEFESEWRDFLGVRESDLRFLGPAERIRNLSLLRGDISDAALERLAGCHRLEWLDLSYTKVSDQGIPHLERLENLKQLSLVGVPIGDPAAASLAEMKSLEILDLSGTRITDESLQHLARMSHLKSLRLVGTSITDQGISRLRGLRQLEELDVERTQVSAAALAELKQQLPKLK